MGSFFHCALGSVNNLTGQLPTGSVNIITARLAHDNGKSVFHQYFREAIDPAI